MSRNAPRPRDGPTTPVFSRGFRFSPEIHGLVFFRRPSEDHELVRKVIPVAGLGGALAGRPLQLRSGLMLQGSRHCPRSTGLADRWRIGTRGDFDMLDRPVSLDDVTAAFPFTEPGSAVRKAFDVARDRVPVFLFIRPVACSSRPSWTRTCQRRSPPRSAARGPTGWRWWPTRCGGRSRMAVRRGGRPLASRCHLLRVALELAVAAAEHGQEALVSQLLQVLGLQELGEARVGASEAGL